jgi:hypothetical protein
MTRSLPAGQMQPAQDRASISAYIPETATIRFENWHSLWRPILFEDLAQRPAAAGASGGDGRYEDSAVLHRVFAALELALEAWHDASWEGHPVEFLERAVAEIFPDLGAT